MILKMRQLEMGFSVRGLTWSPITGPEGNIEYLLYLANGTHEGNSPINVADVVKKAHDELNRK